PAAVDPSRAARDRGVIVEAPDDPADRDALLGVPAEGALDPGGGLGVDRVGAAGPLAPGLGIGDLDAAIAEGDGAPDQAAVEQAFVGGADILRIHAADHLIGHGVELQGDAPPISVVGVEAILDEDAADAPLDDLLLHELYGPVHLAGEPV